MSIAYLIFSADGDVSVPNPLDGEFGSVLPVQKYWGQYSDLPLTSKFVSVPYSNVFAIWDEGSTGSNNRFEMGQWIPFWPEPGSPDMGYLENRCFAQFSFRDAPAGADVHGQYVVAFHVE